MNNNGAIFYDFLKVHGGAEDVSLNILKRLGNTKLYVDFTNETCFSPYPDILNLGKPTAIPGWQTIKGLHNFKYKTKDIKKYDWAIFSGSNALTAVHNRSAGKNIYYCHTPPRFIYDLKHYYFQSVPYWQLPLLKALIFYSQPKYEDAIKKMDIVIANSNNVKTRLLKYLNINSKVIYPPCDISSYQWQSQDNFYLSTARLEPYKRVDIIVQAFKQMPDKKLIISSGGSELANLMRLAGSAENIIFTGWLNKKVLTHLVTNCISTIYIPKNEDFGISPVESMAAGKPVIGVTEGGLLETVIPNKTGILLSSSPKPVDIIQAIHTMTPQQALAMRKDCENHAQSFHPDIFFKKIQDILDAFEST